MSSFVRCTRLAGAAAALCLVGCDASARVAQTALSPIVHDAVAGTGAVSSDEEATGPTADAGSFGPDETPAASGCPETLAERLSVSSVKVSRDIRYKLLGYENFPFDERVAFAPAPDGSAYVAWTDDADGRVLVTPLDASYKRAGADVETHSWEIGGIVARPDGFALLTLRDDPAASSAMSDNFGRAVTLVRYQRGVEAFAVPLTGARAITQPYATSQRDGAPGYLYGRLAWNGAKYGAYFIVQTALDDPQSSQLTDKLVYADDAGQALPGGFLGKCTSNQGLRLWPEAEAYTPICLADQSPFPGLNLVIEDQPPRLLATEAAAPGWSGGQMGSIVKLADGTYVIGWLSREAVPGGAPDQTAREANDIAMLRLGPDRQAIGQKRWLVETQGVAETNLHFARYGQSQVLMVWDVVRDVRCDKMCFGTYAGTEARVLDREGNVMSAGMLSAVPNHHDDLVTLPNGDVAWAFVPDPDRDYSAAPPSRGSVVLAAPKRTFQVARLRYCE